MVWDPSRVDALKASKWQPAPTLFGVMSMCVCADKSLS